MAEDPAAKIQRHLGSGILIDTNLLLVYFLGKYEMVSGYSVIETFRYSKGKYTTRDSDVLATLVERFRVQITTPHILTEVSNMLGHLRDPAREVCFSLMKRIVPLMRELHLPSEDLVREKTFTMFGLTDTGIQKIAKDPCLVLTDDYRLSGYLDAIGIDALNFNHIRLLS